MKYNGKIAMFSSESANWLAWRIDEQGYSIFINLNKHDGRKVIRRIYHEGDADWKVLAIIIIATLSGALAAGLWR